METHTDQSTIALGMTFGSGPEMSGTPESRLADPNQVIADLQRQVAECKAELDQRPPNMMHCGANLSDGRPCIKVSATHWIFFQRYWHPGGKSIVGRASDHYRPATIVRVPKECQAIKGLFAAAAWLALVPGTESRR